MITCFIHPKFHSSSGYSFEQFIHTVFLFVFTLIPCINFFYGLAEAIIIFNTIRNQNDQEGRALFKKYVVYIGSYLLLTFFMLLFPGRTPSCSAPGIWAERTARWPSSIPPG